MMLDALLSRSVFLLVFTLLTALYVTLKFRLSRPRSRIEILEPSVPAAVLATSHDAGELADAIEEVARTLDRRAVEPLGRLLTHPDPRIAAAAANVLGLIGDERALEFLFASVGRLETELEGLRDGEAPGGGAQRVGPGGAGAHNRTGPGRNGRPGTVAGPNARSGDGRSGTSARAGADRGSPASSVPGPDALRAWAGGGARVPGSLVNGRPPAREAARPNNFNSIEMGHAYDDADDDTVDPDDELTDTGSAHLEDGSSRSESTAFAHAEELIDLKEQADEVAQELVWPDRLLGKRIMEQYAKPGDVAVGVVLSLMALATDRQADPDYRYFALKNLELILPGSPVLSTASGSARQGPTPEQLARELGMLLSDPAPSIRYAAVAALEVVRIGEVADYIEGAMADPNQHVRARACMALAGLAPGRARKHLFSLLSDPDAQVRRAAQRTLDEMDRG